MSTFPVNQSCLQTKVIQQNNVSEEYSQVVPNPQLDQQPFPTKNGKNELKLFFKKVQF